MKGIDFGIWVFQTGLGLKGRKIRFKPRFTPGFLIRLINTARLCVIPSLLHYNIVETLRCSRSDSATPTSRPDTSTRFHLFLSRFKDKEFDLHALPSIIPLVTGGALISQTRTLISHYTKTQRPTLPVTYLSTIYFHHCTSTTRHSDG